MRAANYYRKTWSLDIRVTTLLSLIRNALT